MTSSAASPRRHLPWIVLPLLMVLLVVMRTVPAWSHLVLPDGGLVLPGNDPYYHLRQALYTLHHFPHLLRWDNFSHYPEVLRNDAAGLYDLALATLAKNVAAVSSLPPERALLWVCLWFPPLCMAAILPCVFDLVRRQSSQGVALLMTCWIVLIPGETLLKTMLGFCDHHVVEMLLSVLAVRGWMKLVVAERAAAAPWWRPAWLPALPLALIQFVWLGGPLWLPLFFLALAGQLAADLLAGAGVRPVLRAAARYWLAFLVFLALLGSLWPESRLDPRLWGQTLLGAGVLLAALPLARWYFESPRLRLSASRRLGLAAAAIAAGLGAILAFSPAARLLAGQMFADKAGTVEENVRVTQVYYFRVTSLAGILALLTPAAGILTGAWRRPGWWSVVLPSLGYIALWCRASDYGYQGALHAVILAGCFFGTARALDRKEWWHGRPALAGVTLAVILLSWPLRVTAPWWLPFEEKYLLADPGWTEAMTWLRTHSPAPAPVAAAPQLPLGRAGVLTDWVTGNFVATLAQRPATASRYPEPAGLAPFFQLGEAGVRASPLNGSTVAAAVRYVVVEPKLIGDYLQRHLALVGADAERYQSNLRLSDLAGHEESLPSLGGDYNMAFATRLLLEDGSGFAHFRLVFESRQESFLRLLYDPSTRLLSPRANLVQSRAQRAKIVRALGRRLWPEGRQEGYAGHLLASVKIFEQVPGARLAGRAPPDTIVTLDIPLRLRTSGRKFDYRQVAITDHDGRFDMTVPCATEAAPDDDATPDGPATVSWGDSSAPIAISASAVRTGATVAWPAPIAASTATRSSAHR